MIIFTEKALRLANLLSVYATRAGGLPEKPAACCRQCAAPEGREGAACDFSSCLHLAASRPAIILPAVLGACTSTGVECN